jgi:hypothetical protein
MQSSVMPTSTASTQRVSIGLFLLAAAASFGLSVTLWFTGNEQQGIFVGLWVPSILSLGALLRPNWNNR